MIFGGSRETIEISIEIVTCFQQRNINRRLKSKNKKGKNKMKNQSKKLLELDNRDLNKAVKIGGTDFDRHHKLTKCQIKDIQKSFKQGESYAELARQYNVAPATIKYHVDSDFRLKNLAIRREHEKKFGHTAGLITLDNRAEYKRQLIKEGKIK